MAVDSESGPHGPLTNGSYSFQAIYSGDSNYQGSTSDCEPLTVNPSLNRTQGYWKTHGTNAPGNQANVWPVSSIDIGGVTYSEDEAIAIMNTATIGNAISSLFQQLVAYKLNVLSNFSVPTAAEAAAAADADAAIALATGGNKLLINPDGTLNYIVAPSSVLGARMIADMTILTAFNESGI